MNIKPKNKICQTTLRDLQAKSFTLVIFGGTGDLSKKKLIPALYSLYQKQLIKNFSILAIGRTNMTDAKYRSLIKQTVKPANKKNWQKFSRNLFYEVMDITEEPSYTILCNRVHDLFKKNKSNNLLYYLAIRPNTVPTIVEMLALKNMCRQEPNAKIIIEKPFGKNKKTAIKLNKCLLKRFDEQQIYRIDHYLGKETVQNILFFRFGNNIFEPLWNRNYIDHVQITVAEKIDIENRGQFYEETGVIRDIVQNHIMQLISLVAMEPPVSFTANLIRDEKAKIFRAIRAEKNIVLGQYDTYRKEKNVAPNSKTPTYFAGKFYIDNWRWAGIPFYVRTGKSLSKKTTEIVVQFKNPPLKLLGSVCDIMQSNTLIISIQPQEKISLGFSVKYPGTIKQPHFVDMVFNYADTFKIELPDAYSRLLLDCVKSDQTLYARRDEVELMWEAIDPIINKHSRLSIYKTGSHGPKSSENLLKKDGYTWHKL